MYIPKNAFYNPSFNPYKVNCEQQTCADLDAYVSCVGNILQGRPGCIVIQLVDEFGQPLDLNRIKELKVIITNSLGYYVGTWTKKSIQVIKHDNENESGSGISNTGKIRLLLNNEHTLTTTGPLTAQIIIVTDDEMCNEHVISCIVLANIVSNVENNICTDRWGDDENWCNDKDAWVVWDSDDEENDADENSYDENWCNDNDGWVVWNDGDDENDGNKNTSIENKYSDKDSWAVWND